MTKVIKKTAKAKRATAKKATAKAKRVTAKAKRVTPKAKRATAKAKRVIKKRKKTPFMEDLSFGGFAFLAIGFAALGIVGWMIARELPKLARELPKQFGRDGLIVAADVNSVAPTTTVVVDDPNEPVAPTTTVVVDGVEEMIATEPEEPIVEERVAIDPYEAVGVGVTLPSGFEIVRIERAISEGEEELKEMVVSRKDIEDEIVEMKGDRLRKAVAVEKVKLAMKTRSVSEKRRGWDIVERLGLEIDVLYQRIGKCRNDLVVLDNYSGEKQGRIERLKTDLAKEMAIAVAVERSRLDD